MREPVATVRAGDRQEQSRQDGFIDEVHRRVDVKVADPAQDLQAEFGTEGGTKSEDPAAALAEVLDPPRDDGPDPGRDHERQGRQVGDVVESPLGGQQADGFADEQRVAVRLPPDRGDQVIVRHGIRGRADERLDRIGLQPGQHQRPGDRLAGDFGQGGGQRMIGGQHDIAVGPDQEHRHVRHLARHEAEQQDRGRVGRMEVVEDDEQRVGGGRIAQEGGGRVEQLEARRLRFRIGRSREVREAVAQLREHLGDVPRT